MTKAEFVALVRDLLNSHNILIDVAFHDALITNPEYEKATASGATLDPILMDCCDGCGDECIEEYYRNLNVKVSLALFEIFGG